MSGICFRDATNTDLNVSDTAYYGGGVRLTFLNYPFWRYIRYFKSVFISQSNFNNSFATIGYNLIEEDKNHRSPFHEELVSQC